MLVIRREQQEELRRHSVDGYVERTLGQFKEHFPRHCETSGDEAMRKMIRLGIDRASARRMTAESGVTLYTSLMLLFGSYFDEDPMYPWARQVLEAGGPATEAARAASLYDAGVDFWERMGGSDNRNFVVAISRLRKISPGELGASLDSEGPRALERIFPEKARLLDATGLESVLVRSRDTAARHHLERPSDRATCAALAFMLGCRFADDPMFPWARSAIEAASASALDRGDELLRRAHAYADAWLAHVA